MFKHAGPILSRSVLYSLEPVKVNSEFRESLSGYISRLAINHNITQGTLFTKLITPLLDKKYLNNIASKGGDGFYESARGINGIGNLADDFVEVISKLTVRKDLNELTLLSWANFIPTKGLLRLEKAWCPICYLDALNKNLVVYDQLIWTLKIVNHCPIHKVQLANECPFCSKKMHVLSRKSNPGYCSNCGQWIGIITKNSNRPTDEDLKILTQITNLLSISNGYQRGAVSEALKYYVKIYFADNINNAASYLGMAKSTFRCWVRGENIPTLKSLVLICIKLDITISDFLNKKPLTHPISERNVQSYKNKVRKKHDHVFIKKYLSDYIREGYLQSPQSLKKISDFLGCDRRLLYVKYPEESKLIVGIYSEYLKIKKTSRQKQAENEVTKAVRKLESQNQYPSRRKVEANLNGSYLVKEREIALIWRNLLNRHNYPQ